MEFVEIYDLNNALDVKMLYQDSFPVEEQVEFEKLFSGVFKNYKMFCIYEKNIIVAMVHFKELKNFTHVNYLAVRKEYQNKGYGSLMLSFIKNNVKNPLVLDVEEIDELAANCEDRKRRIKFYKKNGFKGGKYKFIWGNVLMTLMFTSKIDEEEFMDYIQIVFPTIRNVTLKKKTC